MLRSAQAYAREGARVIIPDARPAAAG